MGKAGDDGRGETSDDAAASDRAGDSGRDDVEPQPLAQADAPIDAPGPSRRGDEPQEPLARLDDAERAFAAGDFARLRVLVEPLTQSTDPAIAGRAKALRARVSVDPLQVAVLVACAIFFFWVVAKYVL